jgi:hypothetical protein
MNRLIKKCISGLFLMLAVFVIACGSTPSSGSIEKERTRRQKIYYEAIKAEGFMPIIEDNRIVFKYQGDIYTVRIGRDDPTFVYVQLPNFWLIGPEAEMRAALAAIGNANRKTKVAKAYLTQYQGEDSMTVGAEFYFENPNDFRPLLPRMLRVIELCVTEIIEEMTDKGW